VHQAHISNDPDDVRRAFVESGELALRPVDAQEVADRLAQGLLVCDMSVDPPCDEDMPPLVPLLRARLRALPPAAEMDQPSFADLQRQAILDEFAQSKEAGRSKRAIDLADLFASCRLERLDADPLRWSPIAVELCLLDWLPRKVTLDDADLRALPDALKSWVSLRRPQEGPVGRCHRGNARCHRRVRAGLQAGDARPVTRAVSDIVFVALNEPLEDWTDDMRAALDALGRDGPNG
jgi:hypothetical protein